MRDALAPRISWTFVLVRWSASKSALRDRYRRFAFRFFAALRGAFFAVFLAFLAFDFFATFLAAFFAFLAMPWLLVSTATQPQYFLNMSCASTFASEKIHRAESATAHRM
jgi:hypothetical protein